MDTTLRIRETFRGSWEALTRNIIPTTITSCSFPTPEEVEQHLNAMIKAGMLPADTRWKVER